MPCYQVNTISLDFHAGDLALLQKAAAVLGLVVIDAGLTRELRDRAGRAVASLMPHKALCLPEHLATVNKLRVEYSRQIVSHAALKLGWQKVAQANNKLVLRKGV